MNYELRITSVSSYPSSPRFPRYPRYPITLIFPKTPREILKFKYLFVGQFHVLANTRHDDAGTLPMGLLHHYLAHYLGIGIVEMADGLVGQDEIERLHQRTNHGHTLLLSETHTPYFGIQFVAYAQAVEPFHY